MKIYIGLIVTANRIVLGSNPLTLSEALQWVTEARGLGYNAKIGAWL